MPITVPMVSKKSESISEKIVTSAVMSPRRTKTEKSKPAPRLEKSGSATSAAGHTAWPGSGKARPAGAGVDRDGEGGGGQDADQERPG